jgi:hypothetical protein
LVKDLSRKENTKLNKVLLFRRSKMLRMLASGYPFSLVVETLSKEYKCSQAAISRDYDRLNVWAHAAGQDMESTSILGDVLDETSSAALRAIVEQIGLVQELGLLEGKGFMINEKVPVVTPFEADPTLREALVESIAKQKAEKVERDAAKASDASRR